MIQIIDDWYVEIESNPTNYILKRGSGERDAKGRCRDKVYGYFTSLQNAIKALRKEMIADKLSSGFHTLSQAFQTIREMDSRIEKVIERINA